MKRRFTDYCEAEDFANDMVFGGDDPNVVAELVEVWPDEDAFDDARITDAWGTLYAVWGTDAEVDEEIAHLGPFIDSKGRTGRPEEEV